MVYEHFRANKNLGLVYTIFDLSRVTWSGDEKLETFRNNWETTIAGMVSEVDNAHLTELLLTQKELKEQVTRFRKRDPDDPERCYQALIDYIDEHLIYQQELKNRSDQKRRRHTLPHQALPSAHTGWQAIAPTASANCNTLTA